MNFEANYLSNYRQYKPYPPQNCSTVRIKTWNDDIVQDDMSNKRFKRSQSKTFKFNNNTCYPNQSFQAGSFRVKKNVPCEKPDRANNSYNFQSVKQTNSEVTQVWRQKCLTQPIYFHKTPLNKNNIECQSPKTTYLDNLSASQCHPFEGNANDMYPLRFITPNLYPQNSQINDKNMNYSYVKRDDFVKRDVSINLQNRCQNQTLKVKYKQVDENKNMLNLADTKYNSLVNLSTESSIHTNQIKNTKKITTSTQTQNKKTVAMAINTISNRCNSIKIQTDETMSSIQKLNESMKNKIECLEGENKKLKAELVCANKQKQQLKKQINQKKQPFQKKANLKTLACVKSKEKLQIIGDTKEKQSLKDTTLFSLVQNLKQEITVLKQGYGLKKIEQILQNVKRENALLSNQLQAVSLKCRVLEQQNSQYTTVEQQNRRIKLQMRYMRAGMKDYKLELDRLKGQNQKLRDNKMIKKAGNGIEESKVFTNWGSETDSLCLSISFAGE